ncbi:MAG: hypothetical protein ACOZE7_03095 [Pseudomonadota bacterium]
MTQQPSSASLVHTRTVKGQAAVLASAPDLNPLRTKLLRMVNGFTPTEWLIHLLSSDQRVPDNLVSDLERDGLIARID